MALHLSKLCYHPNTSKSRILQLISDVTKILFNLMMLRTLQVDQCGHVLTSSAPPAPPLFSKRPCVSAGVCTERKTCSGDQAVFSFEVTF